MRVGTEHRDEDLILILRPVGRVDRQAGGGEGAVDRLDLGQDHPERVGDIRLAADLKILAAAHLGGVHQRV